MAAKLPHSGLVNYLDRISLASALCMAASSTSQFSQALKTSPSNTEKSWAAAGSISEVEALKALWKHNQVALKARGWKEPTPSTKNQPGIKVDDKGRVTDIHLPKYNLTTLPAELCQLPYIKDLGATNNKLTSIPPEIGQLTTLTSLVLYDNQLTSLPTELVQLTCLTWLALAKNKIRSIPPELGQMSSLTSLGLSDNHLTEIPAELGKLTRLRQLGFRMNYLLDVPKEVKALKAFQYSDLNNGAQYSRATLPPAPPPPATPSAHDVPAKSSASFAAAMSSPAPAAAPVSATSVTSTPVSKPTPPSNNKSSAQKKSSPATPSTSDPAMASQWATSASNSAPKLAVGVLDSNFSFTPGNATSSSSAPLPQVTADFEAVSSNLTSKGVPLQKLTILEAIGRGAFGDIIKADWFGTEVAIKTIKVDNDKMKALVLREVTIMSQVRNPHLVSLLGYEMGPNEVKIVMEYMAGGSLDKLLQDKSVKLTWNRAVTIALEIAKGMACLHHQELPVIHRDLKSLNVLVDKYGKICVSDFGLGRTMSENTKMTEQTGSTLWMAPEVMSEQPYGLPADVYSFGIVMWEICARKYPYEGIGLLKLVTGVTSGSLRPPIPPGTPSAWSTLMTRCWSGDPSSRPTFDTILKELKAMQLNESEIGFS